MSVPGSLSLTSMLILALTQSEAVKRQLEDSTRTIARLERANEKLKQELHDLRQKQQQKEQQQLDQLDLPTQFDYLFRQDAEKQAEIDSLKKRLAHATKKRQQTQTPNPSSPNISGDEQATIQTARKRRRIDNQESCSSPGSRQPQYAQSRGVFSNRGAEAIPFVSEDGVDHNKDGEPNRVAESTGFNTSPNRRLQGLLSAASRVRKAAPRPLSASKAPTASKGPEDDEPLRCRPLHRLSLTHFKVNPKFTDGLAFVFQEVVRNKEARKCLPSCTKPECCGASFNALARTLPPDPTISEDDLLVEFLGAGSEERIKGLTPLARTNLVHEARAKRLANAYGRMHRANFEAPSTPPNFWNVDLPGTQEEKENQAQMKLKEREEVEKRYSQAMNGGRWLFTDE